MKAHVKQSIPLGASSQQSALNVQNWANIADTYLLQPIYGGDGRVLIRQDEFKSRFDCSICNGKGHTGQVCPYCKGTKFEKGKEENGDCRDCTITTPDRISGREGTITLGMEPCPACKGKGGSIIIPDESKTETTIGTVIAVSENGIKHVVVNDKVMYTTYTGNKFEFMQNKLRVCVEKDLLCLVKQLKSGDIGEVGFADLENLGVPRE